MVRIDSQLEASTGRFTRDTGQRERPSVDRPTFPEADHSTQQDANEMATGIWSRLPIARIADEIGCRNIEQVIRVSSSSHSQIVRWYSELRDFVDAICHTAIELRGDEESSDAFCQDLIREIKDRTIGAATACFDTQPVPSGVGANA